LVGGCSRFNKLVPVKYAAVELENFILIGPHLYELSRSQTDRQTDSKHCIIPFVVLDNKDDALLFIS